MKNTQKGFIIPLVMIILVLAIGGGSYVYLKEDKASQDSIRTTMSSEGVVENEDTPGAPNLNKTDNKKDETKEVKDISEKASGIIRSVYDKDGKNYLDIDYVEFVSGGPNGVTMNNNNPKIRTFGINNDAEFLIRASCLDKNKCTGEENEAITFNQFFKIFNEKGYHINNATYLKDNPWAIEVENGFINKVTEIFRP